MVFLGRRIHERSLAIQDHFGTLTNFVHENVSGVRVVRAYRQETSETGSFARLNEQYVRLNLRLARAQGIFHPLLGFLGGLGAVVVRQITIGNIERIKRYMGREYSRVFDGRPIHAIRLTGDGRPPIPVWATQKPGPQEPSLLYYRGLLYALMDNGVLVCLDGKTGEEKYRQRLGGDCNSTPVASDGRIYASNNDGTTFVVRLPVG